MRPIRTSLLFVAALAAPADAIVMRHDVEEMRYLELAVGRSGSFVELDGGCGTFISPTWILTAAHVADSRAVGATVTVDGIEYAVKRTMIHPGFTLQRGVLNDIALIELATPVPGITPARLYRHADEVGKEVLFVGTGWAGTGDRGMRDGAIMKDGQLRAAQNRVDGTKPGYVRFTFNSPGSDAAMPLEGISGPGDSGGPALWFDGDQAFVLGVSSHQDRNGSEVGGVYGVYEFYARVSEYADWIDAAMADADTGAPGSPRR